MHNAKGFFWPLSLLRTHFPSYELLIVGDCPIEARYSGEPVQFTYVGDFTGTERGLQRRRGEVIAIPPGRLDHLIWTHRLNLLADIWSFHAMLTSRTMLKDLFYNP